MNTWEQNYKKIKDMWGLEPENMIVTYKPFVRHGKILDLGIGEGRNSLLFARESFEIEGVDISETALSRCNELFQNFNCNCKLINHPIENYIFASNDYSLIISSWVLNFMKKSEAINIFLNAQHSLISGGLIYIGVLTTSDPQYEMYKEKFEEIEKDTFYNAEKNLTKTFFDKTDFLTNLGEKFKIISQVESYSLDFSHGDEHYHGTFELLVRKR